MFAPKRVDIKCRMADVGCMIFVNHKLLLWIGKNYNKELKNFTLTLSKYEKFFQGMQQALKRPNN
jgi:hypothetical protein